MIWTHGTPKVFASSTVAERSFCAEWGTPLTYLPRKDRISVTVGSLDRLSSVAPLVQYDVDSKIAWLDSISLLPEHEIAGFFGPAVRLESRQHRDEDT